MKTLSKRTAEYRAVNEYLKGEKQSRAGFTTAEGEAIIVKELLQPQWQLEHQINLIQYVNEVPVNTPSGTYPFINRTESKLIAVGQLAMNPEIASPEILPIAYEVTTYRGALPIARETVEDADHDVVQTVAESAKQMDINTKNEEIQNVFRSAAAKPVNGLDELTTLLNTEFKSAYDVKLFLSSSLYNLLDKMKDTTGKYFVFDRDASVESGVVFKGREVVKLDDTAIGTAEGNLVGFVGDAKQFAILFNRQLVTIKWTGNKSFATPLVCASRFDTKKADTEAGFYITYTETV